MLGRASATLPVRSSGVTIRHALRPLPSTPRPAQPPTFREARDLLLHLSDDYHGARAAFSWPRPERFNWALDWFDAELAAGEHGHGPRSP